MKNNKISRRNWLKNTSCLTAGFGSLALGLPALAHPSKKNSALSSTHEEQVIRLFYNENPYGPSPQALSKVMEVANRGNRYATFARYDFDSLREKIAQEEGLTKEHVLLGHGSFQPIIWLAEHFIRKGGTIIVPSPTFDIVGMYARRVKANTQIVEVNDRMEMDLPEMEKHVNQQTALVCICHPNNPTGTLVNPEQLRAFCDRVTKKSPVLVDEAYIQYVDSIPNWRDASMVDQIRAGKNVIISRTFSKIYGMAGFRIGYLLAQPELIKSLSDRFTLGFPGNIPNTLSVAAAIGAMEDSSFLKDSRQKNAGAKTKFYQELEQLNIPFIPTQTNFLFFDVKKFPAFKKLMNEHNILIAGGWPSKSNWARVTFGSPKDMEVFYPLLRSQDWM